MILRILKKVSFVFLIVLAVLSIIYVVVIFFLSVFSHNYAETSIKDYYEDNKDVF